MSTKTPAEKDPWFTKVWAGIFEDARLTAHDLAVYVSLRSLSDHESGWACPSHRTIARRAHTGLHQVRSALDRLMAFGWIVPAGKPVCPSNPQPWYVQKRPITVVTAETTSDMFGRIRRSLRLRPEDAHGPIFTPALAASTATPTMSRSQYMHAQLDQLEDVAMAQATGTHGPVATLPSPPPAPPPATVATLAMVQELQIRKEKRLQRSRTENDNTPVHPAVPTCTDEPSPHQQQPPHNPGYVTEEEEP